MMGKTKQFTDLEVWKKTHTCVIRIYTITKTFPKEELYCLNSQLRRVVVSVPANIAEGYKRRGKKDKVHFLIQRKVPWKK